MTDVVGWVGGPTGRGTLSLVWSCLITIFACTWTVLHLNVPGYYDKPRTIVLRKLKWMVINILFPEFILSKAICDLRLALHELLQFDAYLRECKNDITWVTEYEWATCTSYTKWSWKVETLSGWSNVLYDLFRLPRTLALHQKSHEHQPIIESRSTCGLDSAGIPVPLTDLKTNDSATCTEGEPLDFVETHPPNKQHSPQRGPQLSGRAAQIFHEDAEEGHRRPSDVRGVPLQEHRLHTIHSNTCDLIADTSEQNRYEIDENDLEMGPKIQDRHAVGPKSQTAPSQEEPTGRPKTQETSNRYTWSHREQKWTITHSYYAQMGGLVALMGAHDPVGVITTSKLTRQETDPKEEHPLKYLILGKEDIEDKSKADWFLKSLAILQVTSLVLNVIVRHATGLPITQLEVATVAFAIMAVLSYLANWWKPKDISRPTVLLSRRELRQYYSHSTHNHTQSFMQRLRKPGLAGENIFSRTAHIKRMGNDVVWLEGETPLLYYLMAGSSLVFGGLHCLAWDFEFPTRVELICWRAASVTSAVLPVVSLAISAFLGYLTTSYLSKQFKSKWMAGLKDNLKFEYQPHPQWWEMFLKPQFFSLNWDNASLHNLYQRPAASRNWEKPQPPGNPHVRMALSSSENALHGLKSLLSSFQDTLTTCIAGTADPHQWREVSRQWDVQGIILLLRQQPQLLEFWNDYENFARGRLGDLKLTTACGETTCLEVILKATKNPAMWAVSVERRFRRAPNAVFTISLILYAASRLIILVILFTSLRAAPAGVYQNTVWTRFLPSFS